MAIATTTTLAHPAPWDSVSQLAVAMVLSTRVSKAVMMATTICSTTVHRGPVERAHRQNAAMVFSRSALRSAIRVWKPLLAMGRMLAFAPVRTLDAVTAIRTKPRASSVTTTMMSFRITVPQGWAERVVTQCAVTVFYTLMGAKNAMRKAIALIVMDPVQWGQEEASLVGLPSVAMAM